MSEQHFPFPEKALHVQTNVCTLTEATLPNKMKVSINL